MPRQQVYTILIAISAALMLGRIMAVDRVDLRQLEIARMAQVQPRLDAKEAELRKRTSDEEAIRTELDRTRQNLIRDAMLESPMLCGNDRSRWCTIRALVEPGMRVVRTVTRPDGSPRYEYVWYAIDKVQTIKGWDTIDMVKHELPDQPGPAYLYSSKPPLLPTVLALPYAAIYWGSGQRITLEKEPYFVVRSMLVLLNLLPLIFCWFLSTRLIDRFGMTDWARIFCVAAICFGTFLSTFVVTLNNHLPAVFCVTIAFYCAVRIFFDGETRLRYFAGAGFFAAFAVACELPAASFFGLLGLLLLLKYPRPTLLAGTPAALVVIAAFFATNYAAHQTVLPAYSQRAWYIYEFERGGVMRDSYWKNPVGIDRGEPSRADYVFHSTIGHHGLFSLTPVWILSFVGLAMWLLPGSDPRLRIASSSILFLSLLVFSFWMGQEQANRNYGGMSSALRWMFWLIPLWAVPTVVIADRLGRRVAGRAFCLTLLGISIFSATYPIWNPWTQPWIYHLMVYLGRPVI